MSLLYVVFMYVCSVYVCSMYVYSSMYVCTVYAVGACTYLISFNVFPPPIDPLYVEHD